MKLPLYLSGVSGPEARDMMALGLIGQIRQPNSGNKIYSDLWAADNGCFNARFDPNIWEAWITSQPPTALWAVVPDVPLDHEETMVRWRKYLHIVKNAGFKAAFAAQDDCMVIPWDADALFLGGSDAWKVGDEARALVDQAILRGIPAHMGRVNSYKRYKLAGTWGCDTVDGTFLGFAPKQNVPRMMDWFSKMSWEVDLSKGQFS